jgi:hypothetical protein
VKSDDAAAVGAADASLFFRLSSVRPTPAVARKVSALNPLRSSSLRLVNATFDGPALCRDPEALAV